MNKTPNLKLERSIDLPGSGGRGREGEGARVMLWFPGPVAWGQVILWGFDDSLSATPDAPFPLASFPSLASAPLSRKPVSPISREPCFTYESSLSRAQTEIEIRFYAKGATRTHRALVSIIQRHIHNNSNDLIYHTKRFSLMVGTYASSTEIQFRGCRRI